MKKAIIGAGGFAKEVYADLSIEEKNEAVFFVDEKYWDATDPKILPLSEFNPIEYKVVVAIGNPRDRSEIVKKLPQNTQYFIHISPTAKILGDDVKIGEGSIICAGTIITTNVHLGKHTHLNLQTTIGHDCRIGDFFTTAPGAKISGNCHIGDRVYVGTNASIKEKLSICTDVIIGMGAAVSKSIEESGIYVGIPAKKK